MFPEGLTPDQRTSLILAQLVMALLVLGTLAKIFLWVTRRGHAGPRPSGRDVARAIHTDVRRGVGFVETGRALRGETPRQRQTVYTGRRAPRGFMSSRTRRRLHSARTNGHSADSNAAAPGVQRSNAAVERDDSALPRTIEELRQLADALTYYAKTGKKQESIARAAGQQPGGGKKYRRLAELFDAATEPPTRYPQRTPAQEAAREELGLEVKR